MRWSRGDRSSIEDRRGWGGGMRAAPIGCGGLVVLLLLSWLTGADFLSLLGPVVEQSARVEQGGDAPVASSPEEEQRVDFVDAVMREGLAPSVHLPRAMRAQT